MELYEHHRHVQLLLELGIALRELGVELVLRVQLGLPARLVLLEACGATHPELGPPRVQVGAINALLAQHRLDRPPLPARTTRVGALDDPQLLRGAELAPPPLRYALDTSSARTALTLALLALRGFSISNRGRLRHGGDSILRPSSPPIGT